MSTKTWNQMTVIIISLTLLLSAFVPLGLTAAGMFSVPLTSGNAGIVRYEEDDPALLYNGVPYDQRPSSWTEQFQSVSSGGYTARSITADDTVSLTFDGRWASIGFFTHVYGGQAEIFVDGLSQGIIGLYSDTSDVTSFAVGDLPDDTHTISVTVLGLPDPPGTQTRVHLDYIDVWDGQNMPDDIVNANTTEDNGRVQFSAYLSTEIHANAINGDYVYDYPGSPDANVWYSFTGDNFTFYGFSNNFGNG
jgi:hypothetical protein